MFKNQTQIGMSFIVTVAPEVGVVVEKFGGEGRVVAPINSTLHMVATEAAEISCRIHETPEGPERSKLRKKLRPYVDKISELSGIAV